MRLTRILVVGGVLAAVALSGWYFYQQALPEAVTGKIIRGVAVQAVPANVLVTAQFPMELKSELPTSSRLLVSNVRLGLDVKKGAVLFEIDAEDLKSEIELIEINYTAEKARIELGSPVEAEIVTARENLENSQRLLAAGRLSQIEFDRAQRGFKALETKLALEKITNDKTLATFDNTLKTKRRQVERAKIVAPADGTITEIPINPGDLVSTGTVIARMISKERLVQAQISEENLAGVRPGLPANVSFLGYGGKGDRAFKATVENVLPSLDERTKRYTAFLKVEGIREVMLFPGLTGDAVITIDRRPDALLADRRAMIGDSVLVVRDGHVRLKRLDTGFSGMEYTEVVQGLNEGDEVVVQDTAKFRDGQRVRVVRESEL